MMKKETVKKICKVVGVTLYYAIATCIIKKIREEERKVDSEIYKRRKAAELYYEIIVNMKPEEGYFASEAMEALHNKDIEVLEKILKQVRMA